MSASVETIEGTRVVVLREPGSGAEAWVVAEVGSNLARFRARAAGEDGEVLAAPPDMATQRERALHVPGARGQASDRPARRERDPRRRPRAALARRRDRRRQRDDRIR
jgi:hypothetical protein